MDLSLDDIIKKKGSNARAYLGMKGKPSFRRQNNVGVTKLETGQLVKKAAGRAFGTAGRTVGDARLRIIQQKRGKLIDARDKLVEIAQQSDARVKLEKLKGIRMKNNLASRWNGKILPLIQTKRTPRGMPAMPITHLQRSINQNTPARSRVNLRHDLDLSGKLISLRRTVDNAVPGAGLPGWAMYSNQPEVSPPTPRPLIHPQRFTVQNVGEQDVSLRLTDNYRNTADDYRRPQSGLRSRSSYEDRGRLGRGQSGRLSSELKARLDKPMYNRAPAAVQGASPDQGGHRIVVSNLQTNVTNEDIKELFEDIGQLLCWRVLRPGVAEVVYRQQKDAVSAVEAYHNRQLDGHPMKCMLVNPRTRPTQSQGRSSGGAITKLQGKNRSPIPIDIGAIHKALFNK